MSNYAVMDIGTNSIKFMIYSKTGDEIRILLERSNISRLGEGLHRNGMISAEAMKRNLEVIAEFIRIGSEYGVTDIQAFGTMCLRSAENSGEFISLVSQEAGLQIAVLSGEEEAKYSFLGASSGIDFHDEKVMLFDTGGGSTEFIGGENGKIRIIGSVDMGAVQPSEMFLSDPPAVGEVKKMLEYIKNVITQRIPFENIDRLIGIGGTVTTLGAVSLGMKEYDAAKVDGLILGIDEVRRQFEMYAERTAEERKSIAGLHPGRADVILGGAGIVMTIMSHYSMKTLTISTRGLRYGMMHK